MKNFLLLLLSITIASCSLTRSDSFFGSVKNFYYRHIANNSEDLIALKNTIADLEATAKGYKDLLPDDQKRINLFSYKKALKANGLVKFQELYSELKGKMLLAKTQMIPVFSRERTKEEGGDCIWIKGFE